MEIDLLESELRMGINLLDDKIKRVETIGQIVESFSQLSSTEHSQMQDTEEYYLSQIHKWIIFGERKSRELEKQESVLLETQKKYLSSLKKIKELENEVKNISGKCKYYRSFACPNLAEEPEERTADNKSGAWQ